MWAIGLPKENSSFTKNLESSKDQLLLARKKQTTKKLGTVNMFQVKYTIWNWRLASKPSPCGISLPWRETNWPLEIGTAREKKQWHEEKARKLFAVEGPLKTPSKAFPFPSHMLLCVKQQAGWGACTNSLWIEPVCLLWEAGRALQFHPGVPQLCGVAVKTDSKVSSCLFYYSP